MSLKSHATIVSDVQSLLGGNTTDFTSAILTTRIAEGLQELSRYCPYVVLETVTATEDSKELNISHIENLLWLQALEYRVGKEEREWRTFVEYYKDSISMEIDFWPEDEDSAIDTNEVLDASETGVDCDASATTAIPVGTIIRIENELMYVTATGTTLTVVRGYNHTTATTHVTDTDIYKPELAYLYCAKAHKVPTLTDLAGAVDLVAGYAAGLRTIHIDGMGASDTLEKDMLFTIASDGSGTIYRLTEDTTLATNEGDIIFEPGLAEAIADDDVVTFKNSTLTPRLETLLIDLVAARSAISIATKFINTVTVGSQSAWRDFLAWGNNHLALTFRKLEEESKKSQKPTKILPRGYVASTS
mgnify:CR=1 FL=1